MRIKADFSASLPDSGKDNKFEAEFQGKELFQKFKPTDQELETFLNQENYCAMHEESRPVVLTLPSNVLREAHPRIKELEEKVKFIFFHYS